MQVLCHLCSNTKTLYVNLRVRVMVFKTTFNIISVISWHREATNTITTVFGLTQLGLETKIYHTRGEHAIHYTTDAVELGKMVWFYGV